MCLFSFLLNIQKIVHNKVIGDQAGHVSIIEDIFLTNNSQIIAQSFICLNEIIHINGQHSYSE